MRKLLIVLFLLSSIAYGEDIVDLDETNTAESIYEKVQMLEEKYSDIIKVVELGRSADNRPIYAVVMTEDVSINSRVPEGYVEKMHFFVEAGIHSRENPGPNIVLRMIEDYAKDYYDDQVIPSYSLRDLLSDNVLHFIVLSNPDGYNLATQGLYSVSLNFQHQLLSFRNREFSTYKANLNGVDLNRNFPGYYYDVDLGRWLNIWNMIHNEYKSYYPGPTYYFGPYEASEVETRILMDYALKYDFRSYLSFHSKGEVLYANQWMLSDRFNERTSSLANLIARETGYEIIEGGRDTSSSGYMTHFTSMNTLKPSITIETVHWREELPVGRNLIKKAYEDVKYVPLIAVIEGQNAGYFDYKWYKDGIYVRDFEELDYALAFYEEYGGKLLRYQGQPNYYYEFERNKVTRLNLIREVMNYISNVEKADPYMDCDDPDVLRAKALGVISDSEYFRPNDFATYEETFVVLKQAFFNEYILKEDHNVDIQASWAVEPLKVLIENKIIDYSNIFVGRINLGELRNYLRLINKMQGE